MTISRVGSGTAVAASIAIPTHQRGDLIFLTIARFGSAIRPTVPSGWTTVFSASVGGPNVYLETAFKIAESASETSGTWTNATVMGVTVYRSDTYELTVGPRAGNSGTAGSGGTVNYPTIIMSSATDQWLIGCVAHSSSDTDIENGPGSGLSNVWSQVGSGEIAFFDSNATKTAWVSTNDTLGAGTSSSYRTVICELSETNRLLSSGSSGGAIIISGQSQSGIGAF